MKATYFRKSLWVMSLLILVTAGVFQTPLVTASPAGETLEDPGVAAVPAGFNRMLEGTGVIIYRNDNYNGYGSTAYVQTIALKRGASVELLHGGVVDPGAGQGRYGGDNPTIHRTSLEDAWNANASANAFCIVNGAFFNPKMSPNTHLSFPLKKDGVLVSGGGDPNLHNGKILMLELWPNRANIRPLTKAALESSSAPDIVAGLAEDFPKGQVDDDRTFVGIDNADGDPNNIYETILIFSSNQARRYNAQPPDASETLRAFGADKIIQFDGGGSTQLKCLNDPPYLTGDGRGLPQTILVAKGTYEFNSQFTNNIAGWQPVNGKWLLSTDGNGLYHTAGLVNLFASTRHTQTYRNLIYEVKMQRSGCTYCANALIIRGDPQPLDSVKNWGTGYYFEYTNSGYVSVWKVDNGVVIPLLDWTSHPAIKQGNWNVLRVTASGNTLKFHINGTKVWSGTNSSYREGAVGIAMYKEVFTFGNRLRVDWARLSTPFGPAVAAEVVSDTEEGLPGGNMLISP
jgi:hypothetical protein